MKRLTAVRCIYPESLFNIEQNWNDNTRASLAAFLVMCEMVLNSLWYGASYSLLHGYGNITLFGLPIVEPDKINDAVLHSMGWAMLGVLLTAFLMNRAFLVIQAKTLVWYLCQSLHIFVYMAYCTLFTQFFGENTIVIGLNLSGGIILGLLLLDRVLILMAFALSLTSFLLIGINRQLHFLPFNTIYINNDPADYWFWIFSHMYFAVTKVVITIVAVDWILKVLAKQQTKIHELSQRDTLTGINNRRTMYCYLNYLWHYPVKMTQISVIYFDLDKFKAINDRHGHTTGDKTLMEVCQLVTQYLHAHHPPAVKFGRIGGEEFIVILPDTTTETACDIAEQLRQRISQYAIISHNGEHRFCVTASFGVASLLYPTGQQGVLQKDTPKFTNFNDYLKNCINVSLELPEAMQDLINIANNGMRTAKQQGRDRVVDGGFTITSKNPTPLANHSSIHAQNPQQATLSKNPLTLG